VVLKEDDDVDGAATTSPREIAAWVAERVSRHKRLDGGVVVVDVVVSFFFFFAFFRSFLIVVVCCVR
jgi:hypothetical protein